MYPNPAAAPSNLIDNIMRSTNVSMHQCTKLEEAVVRSQMPPGCVVIHIHPEGTTSLPDFNLTPTLVKQAVDEACQLTLTWLATNPTTRGQLSFLSCGLHGVERYCNHRASEYVQRVN